MSDPGDDSPDTPPQQNENKTQHEVKKRKIHMDHIDCRDFTDKEGGDRLKNPNSVSFSSKDPNRGLYPAVSRKKPGPAAMGSGFMTASDALNPKLPFLEASQAPSSKPPPQSSTSSKQDEEATPSWWKPKGTKSKLPGQSNTLDKYCVKKTQASFSSSQTGYSSSQTSSSQSSSPSLSQGKTTKMYGAIRKVDDSAHSIFYDGSPKKSQSVTKRLFDAQKGETSSQRKKSKKAPPKFNRDNAFLYSNGSTEETKSTCTFGLLGEETIELSSDEEEDICWFDYLPVEVMENILCRLPLMDLCLNVNTVCKRWNDIISNEKVSLLKVLVCAECIINKLLRVNLITLCRDFVYVISHNIFAHCLSIYIFLVSTTIP